MLMIVTHDVDDGEHWFNSPERAACFKKHGMTVTPFRDPSGAGPLCADLIDTLDMESLQAALATDAARQAEEHDGVHADTIKIFVPG